MFKIVEMLYRLHAIIFIFIILFYDYCYYQNIDNFLFFFFSIEIQLIEKDTYINLSFMKLLKMSLS